MNGDKMTIVDTNASVDGKLQGKDAQVLGRFTGELTLSGRFLMGEGSAVQANVRADAAEIGGDFKGELRARSVVLLEKAKVEGVLEAQSLTVKDGAQLNGSVNAGAGSRSQVSVPGQPGHRPAGALAG